MFRVSRKAAVIVSVLAVIALSQVLVAAGDKETPAAKATSQPDLDSLLTSLRSDNAPARLRAGETLVVMGKASLAALDKLAVDEKAGAEVNTLASRLAARNRLRQYVLTKSDDAMDLAKYLPECVNPLSNLTEEGEAKLIGLGIDMLRIKKMKALLLTGDYFGAGARDFVNLDPDAILVLGKDFGTHGAIYSLGPVVVTENTNVMGKVTAAAPICLIGKMGLRMPGDGVPILRTEPLPNYGRMDPTGEANKDIVTDFGYRLAPGFNPVAKAPELPARQWPWGARPVSRPVATAPAPAAPGAEVSFDLTAPSGLRIRTTQRGKILLCLDAEGKSLWSMPTPDGTTGFLIEAGKLTLRPNGLVIDLQTGTIGRATTAPAEREK